MSIYDEYSEQYRLEELEISERTEAFMEKLKDEEIIKVAKEALEAEESEHVLEEFDLVSKIVDYYDEYKKISAKQKYCLCKAIAEMDYFFNEHFDIEYFRKTHLGNEE